MRHMQHCIHSLAGTMKHLNNMQEIADMAAVCKMIGTVASECFEFQQLLFVNLELHCQHLSNLADGHQFYVGDLSLFEFATIHSDTLHQFNASRQDSICVPALNPAEGQLIYAGINSHSLKVYEKTDSLVTADLSFE